MIPKTGALTLALLAGLAGGCTQTASLLPQSRARVYAADLQGKAAVCTASPVQPEGGKTVTATITTGGAGWCGLTVADDGKPYGAGLVQRRAEKGRVFIHTVGDDTRVDYTPDAAPVADSFTVELVPGNAILAVTVQPAGATSASTPPVTTNTPPVTTSKPLATKGVVK